MTWLLGHRQRASTASSTKRQSLSRDNIQRLMTFPCVQPILFLSKLRQASASGSLLVCLLREGSHDFGGAGSLEAPFQRSTMVLACALSSCSRR